MLRLPCKQAKNVSQTSISFRVRGGGVGELECLINQLNLLASVMCAQGKPLFLSEPKSYQWGDVTHLTTASVALRWEPRYRWRTGATVWVTRVACTVQTRRWGRRARVVCDTSDCVLCFYDWLTKVSVDLLCTFPLYLVWDWCETIAWLCLQTEGKM